MVKKRAIFLGHCCFILFCPWFSCPKPLSLAIIEDILGQNLTLLKRFAKTWIDLQVLYKRIIFALQTITFMNTASIPRKQTSFHLSEELLSRLQEEAKRHNRSLNNLVESVLLAFVAERPNKTTLAAMKEAESSENLETLDLNSFRSFVDSL